MADQAFRSPDSLTIDELLTTTRAVRKRLDLERPVARQTVEECLRLAFQAPSGANAQNWSWLFVDDPHLRASLADIYRAAQAGEPYEAPPGQVTVGMSRSAQYLTKNLQRVPVILIATVDSTFGTTTRPAQASTWGSILPAVWSFMLALRSRGLGSAWTTYHLYREQEVAELLGIPYPEQVQAGMFPIAYTIGTDFKPADRARSESRIFWNGWGVRK
jgi:nitroreductase